MKIIAHRGASGAALENSTQAIRQAATLGVHAIEIDVRLTTDGVLVVNHDSHVFNDRRVIEKSTWDDLRSIVLRDGSPLLRLEDALKIADGTRLVIELKSADSLPALFKVLDKFPKAPVDICSFKTHQLREIKKQRSELVCYALTTVRPLHTMRFAHRNKLEGVGFVWWLLNSITYKRLLKLGLEGYVYTLNNAARGHQLTRNRPEIAICTDYPERYKLYS